MCVYTVHTIQYACVFAFLSSFFFSILPNDDRDGESLHNLYTYEPVPLPNPFPYAMYAWLLYPRIDFDLCVNHRPTYAPNITLAHSCLD